LWSEVQSCDSLGGLKLTIVISPGGLKFILDFHKPTSQLVNFRAGFVEMMIRKTNILTAQMNVKNILFSIEVQKAN
jgi:hypothetical protein